MILHTHVPLSMLLTSFYTYKKPPKPSKITGGPSDAAPPTAAPASGKAEEDDNGMVPDLDKAVAVKEEKKMDEDVKKPAEPDKPASEAKKPLEEPDKPTDEKDKPVDEPDKPADESEKVVEEKGEKKEEGPVVPTDEAPPIPPPAAVVPPHIPLPPRNVRRHTDVTDLAILVKKILSVSEKVARVVSELKKQEGSYSRQASVSTPIADSAPASFDFYMKAMKPIQFGKSVNQLQLCVHISLGLFVKLVC